MLKSVVFVFLWVGLATYADIRFKAAASIATADFAIGAFCYLLTSFLAIETFRQQQWGWIFIIWNCVSFLVGMGLSVLLFREPFTIKRAMATLFTLCAILLSE